MEARCKTSSHCRFCLLRSLLFQIAEHQRTDKHYFYFILFFLAQPCGDALPLRCNDGMAGVGCSPAPRQDPSRAVALSPSVAGCKVAEPHPDYPGLAALSSPRPLLFIVRRAVRLRCHYRQPRFCAARSPARLPLRKKRRLFLGKALK